jgi:hypothetical protein
MRRKHHVSRSSFKWGMVFIGRVRGYLICTRYERKRLPYGVFMNERDCNEEGQGMRNKNENDDLVRDSMVLIALNVPLSLLFLKTQSLVYKGCTRFVWLNYFLNGCQQPVVRRTVFAFASISVN